MGAKKSVEDTGRKGEGPFEMLEAALLRSWSSSISPMATAALSVRSGEALTALLDSPRPDPPL